MRDILEGVVTYGVGVSAYVNGYRVGGKTRTSQTTEQRISYLEPSPKYDLDSKK